MIEKFEKAWIDEIVELMVDVDPKVVGEDRQFEIRFENSSLNVTFEEDWQSKRAMLDVEKSVANPEEKVIEVKNADGTYENAH